MQASQDSADPFQFSRFLDAQDGVIGAVRAELRTGRKATHWMWFIFPQLKGLGQSPMAQHYGISGLEEARAYLGHPELGPRLQDCTRLAIAARPRTVEAIFGYPDHLKFHSSMTLFAQAAGAPSIYHEALDAFFDGAGDARTLLLLDLA